MHRVAVHTDPKPSDAGVTGASTPPIGRYLPVPVQVHEADKDDTEVARCLIALIATRWPATPAEHVGSSAVPGLAGKNIIDLLLAAERADISAITQDLLELGLQRQVTAAFAATRTMLWGAFRHGLTDLPGPRPRSSDRQPRGRRLRGFRDALRADPVLRRRYAALKRAIAAGGAGRSGDLHQGQARLDRRHPGPSWPGGPPAAPPLPGRPGPGQVPPTGLMTHPPFSHECLVSGWKYGWRGAATNTVRHALPGLSIAERAPSHGGGSSWLRVCWWDGWQRCCAIRSSRWPPSPSRTSTCLARPVRRSTVGIRATRPAEQRLPLADAAAAQRPQRLSPLLDGAGTPRIIRGHRPYPGRCPIRCHCAGSRGRAR